jgi:methionyl-tRNA formyltransferase
MDEKSTVSNILFIGKKDDFYSNVAADYLKTQLPNTIIVQSSKAEPIPIEVLNWKGDYIISYLSQWIIPASVLQNASKGGINLHPGSPDYPGIGCTNFAIYNNAKEFGITCHYMLPKVDTGKIIMVERFPVYTNDTVLSITQRAYGAILSVFYKLIDVIISGVTPKAIEEHWTKEPYTRKQLNEMCEIKPEMDKNEIERRIKATTFGVQKWAFLNVNEYIFKLQ